ncbi:DEAD/DEAH box helicase [Penicillium taxi]|uniref:DEAD/DEAH box helicase n=1 Tax=Penicillium taxi TaxID=168475 RepID=UPI0025453F7C|nr:DEAD/DEAH box helicase [Penicillium taxi]KAJ5902701.1 DEAD/DEAH box helicase [Penicillium taxi]
MDQTTLLNWYQSLSTKVVDLVGDLVGDELFIIDGDSLLLHCFSNKKLDFAPGFQLLHATYLVEKFLSQLYQRNCLFEIVFFSQNSQLCLPLATKANQYDRYLLAREAIIQHLESISSRSASTLTVRRFNTFQSKAFDEHFVSSGASLFVCHDGSFAIENHDKKYEEDENTDLEDESSDESNDDEDSQSPPKVQVQDKTTHGTSLRINNRLMIHHLFTHGCNVALIHSVEFRDTKVMAMIIQDHHKKNLRLPISQSDGNNCDFEKSKFVSVQDNKLLEMAIFSQPDLTQRQCLTAVALAMILKTATGNPENKIGAISVILHLGILQDAKLKERVSKPATPVNSAFFDLFLKTAGAILTSTHWKKTVNIHNLPCDLFDLVDGRLFFQVQELITSLGIENTISPVTLVPFNNLASVVDHLCGSNLQYKPNEENGFFPMKKPSPGNMVSNSASFTTVLPFTNEVFEHHLKPIHLDLDGSSDPDEDTKFSNVFIDQTHWHNTKPLDQKKAIASSAWEKRRELKRFQRYMTEIRKYAESLVGSAGMFQKDTIIVGSSSSVAKEKKQLAPKKKSKQPAGKQSVKDKVAAQMDLKAMEEAKKQIGKWVMKQKDFSKITDLVPRFVAVDEYLSSLPKVSRLILEAEILTYLLDTMLQVLLLAQKTGKHAEILAATHVWAVLSRLLKVKQGICADIANFVENSCRGFGLPIVQLKIDSEQPLSFKFSKTPSAQMKPLGLDAVEFQFLHGGPFMERRMDSMPDSRTPDFEPDLWQREVLDQIDAKESALIIAPTSAGKTFISFYAMKQVLKEDNDGIIVYVAPTKALVNQIAAEVQARFSKSYPEKIVKAMWSIHTRDHRINDPSGCQILITVPHILQIMLLAPSNANSWTPRIKRIIFDEVHCIGQAEDGVVWEQLLLLSPCPIIALSATIGNPEEFFEWLKHTQGTNGHNLKMIQHQHRYSDLRKYVYRPLQSFSFKGLLNTSGLSCLGLDDAKGIEFLHPVLTLVDRVRGVPDDFSLEPRDCWTLWKAMNNLQTDEFPVPDSLNPSVLFSGVIIQKTDVIEWQKPLKNLLAIWMTDIRSPFEKLLFHLSHTDLARLVESNNDPSDPSRDLSSDASSDTLQSDEPEYSTLQLICSLHAQRALPALFFNFDRKRCEDIGQQLLSQLQKAEDDWKATSPIWKSQLFKFDHFKKIDEAAKKRSSKATKKKGANDQEMTREDQIRDSASADSNPLAGFDPNRPLEKYSFADPKKLSKSEFAEYASQLKHRQINQWLIDALERGIGIHHAGMNRGYRQVCEILFRKGFLRVVIATGTLALGINMPCKTVVFSGDSIYLTALNFRQAAGRAGRRGFDMLGNVIFQNIPIVKVERLISSRLPDINGHFPITTSLVLRLFILLHGSKQAPSAVKSINSILSSPRICLGGEATKHTVLHYLRFSIEYLRRNNLITITGSPLNFSGCVSHLYYTESSSFAFHALLNSGYLYELCKGIDRTPKRTLRTLMLVMSHVFGRYALRRSTLESYLAAKKRASSVVLLPPLPKKAAKVLISHNNQVLDIYSGYVSTFIEKHVEGPDRSLPFSGAECGGEKSVIELGLPQQKEALPRVISPFYALSGHVDKWDTVTDLCETVRSQVWLEKSAVPYVPITSESDPLNAYLYDFFKHGNVQQLETANDVRRGDVWYLLNDFSMILATIVTSMANILNQRGNTGMEMINVSGGGDNFECEIDDAILDDEEDKAKTASAKARDKAMAPVPERKTKSKTMENWDDELLEDMAKVSLKEKAKRLEESEKKQEEFRKALIVVYRAFMKLKEDFDGKFREMWA